MARWEVKGTMRPGQSDFWGNFKVTLTAETLRKAVETVEETVPGGKVTSIVELVPPSTRD